MPKSQQPWTYLRCLYPRPKISRSIVTAATTLNVRTIPFTKTHGVSEMSHDDRDLRKIFDSRSFWHEFSRSQPQATRYHNAGLFQNLHLTSSEGFEEFAHITLKKCKRIVARVLGMSTFQEYRTIARELDRLSDLLCRIIDLADFVRATHPDLDFQDAASEAHARMFEYMNTLNTTTGLNDQLGKALADPKVTSTWTNEEKTVAHLLKKDFSQSAIDLPWEKRQKFVKLSSTISALGAKFVDEMRPARMSLIIESSRLKGMSPLILKQLEHMRGNVVLPTMGVTALHAIRYVEDEKTRQQVYVASRTAANSQIQVLETLLLQRAELAQLSGFSSYSQMTLADKMAQSPTAVDKFLVALHGDNAPRAQEELRRMLSAKASREHARAHTESQGLEIHAWDRDFFRRDINAARAQASRKPDFLPAYFSLGTVMQGLSRLFSRLYGVRFVPHETASGETWHPDVRRLDVIDESNGHIAVVYCDLFAREGKNPNPAHFTLRCSRLISGDEIAENTSAYSTLDQLHSLTPARLANDGMAVSAPVDSSGSVYQLPTIALICDFPAPSVSSKLSAFSISKTPPPTLLPLPSLITLFHEMGHAIHSILGRTQLQNVSGTRCATDFAELPSVLMERFATDPAVLALFARHWETEAPLPYEMVEAYLRGERGGETAETETQVLLAAVDQAYHGPAVLDGSGAEGGFDSTKVWHEMCTKWGSVPEAGGTSWQGFFGHLVGYGGSYYAYLFDRAIASRVWDGVFKSGDGGEAVSRENGERFKQEVLRWGGARNGWQCIAGVLGEEGKGLEEGGEKAMEEVGRWGVGGK